MNADTQPRREYVVAFLGALWRRGCLPVMPCVSGLKVCHGKRYFHMAVVFRYKGYRFFFFSNEGDPLEAMHIHVRRGEAMAKFWLSLGSALLNHTG
jgi:hypothetical protein